jgi:hypothetical protein
MVNIYGAINAQIYFIDIFLLIKIYLINNKIFDSLKSILE